LAYAFTLATSTSVASGLISVMLRYHFVAFYLTLSEPDRSFNQ